MPKILLEKYPKGTYKGQQSDGRYIDGYLYSNLKILADKIVNDMTFMGICFSSTLEVGTGKSVFCTQMGEAWSEVIKEKYGIDLKYGLRNIVWQPKELIEKAFQIPKYSFILLDEWEDVHYWSELGITLRQFFRKCRQLNLFIMVIIPNFFQMPLSYAVSRSVFAVDVRFEDNFERGFFYFYGFEAKKDLYIRGKKFHNYKVANPDFFGRFVDGYGVPEKEYREAKLKDMMEYDNKEKRQLISPTETEIKAKIIKQIIDNTGFSQTKIGKMLGIPQQSISYFLKKNEEMEKNKGGIRTLPITISSNSQHNLKEIVWDEEKFLEEEKEEQINNK